MSDIPEVVTKMCHMVRPNGFSGRKKMNRYKAALLLLTTTFFWGVTFTVVKQAIESVDVFVFLAQRFILAFALILPIGIYKGKRLDGATILKGMAMGVLLFGAYAFQTVALVYTTASNTGFLTGLNVVMVPILAAIVLKQRVSPAVKAAVVVSVGGLLLLCGNGSWVLNRGDLLAALCADRNKPWATFCNGNKISARRLNTILQKEFGLHSKDIRFKSGVFKGFYKKMIVETYRRFKNLRVGLALS